MDIDLCVCSFVSKLDNHTCPVEILIHHKEWPKSSNTGHFTEKLFTHAQTTIRHQHADGVNWSKNLLLKARPGQQILLLCADPKATPLEILFSAPRPTGATSPLLAVIDGTWNQAEEMLSKDLFLLNDHRVRFAQVFTHTHNNLWNEPFSGGMATIEAIWRAMMIIDPTLDLAAVETFIMIRAERIKWIRKILSANEVTGGIPEAAMAKKNIAG